jgi:ADP-ribose pyrophosphatase YjhB (NUDIX family)
MTLMVRREVQAVIFDEADDARKVLILKKTDYSSRRYRWRLLKGGLNGGESEPQGLQREILEETGLRNIRILDRIYTYEYNFKNTRHLVSTYIVKADSQETVRLQESEVADYMWTTKEKALQMLHWNNEKEALESLK